MGRSASCFQAKPSPLAMSLINARNSSGFKCPSLFLLYLFIVLSMSSWRLVLRVLNTSCDMLALRGTSCETSMICMHT